MVVMANHKLLSPTTTYAVLPDFGDFNELELVQKPFQRKIVYKQRVIPKENSASHNVPIQNRSVQVASFFNVQRSSGINPAKRTRAASVATKSGNKNTSNENRIEDVSSKAAQQTRGQEKTITSTGAVPSVLPGASAQPDVSNNPKGNAAGEDRGCPEKNERKDDIEESDSDSWSSNDFECKRKRSIECLRLPYTAAEDVKIVQYVLDSDNIDRVGSLSLWREMEKKMRDPKRTYQSLKNRFLRNIKPRLLTTYRKFLTKESLTRIKRKFPELKQAHAIQFGVGSNNTGAKEDGSARLGPISSTSRMHSSNYSVFRAENVQQTRPETTVPFVEKTGPVERIGEVVPKNPENRAEVERQEEEAMPGTSATDDTSTAAESFNRGQSRSVTTQSFQCTKIIKALKDKTNLNLNIVLLNGQSPSLLSKLSGPVKLEIVVSVSSIVQNGDEGGRASTLTLEPIPHAIDKEYQQSQSLSSVLMKKKRRKKKKRLAPRRNAKTGPWKRRYILTLKRCGFRKMVNTPASNETLAGLLRKIENNLSQKNEPAKEAKENDSSNRRVLRSHARKHLESRNAGITQETNCSVEDGSDYKHACREMRKTYQMMDEYEQDEEMPRKKQKVDDSGKDNLLVKNTFGMLSSPSKLFSEKQNVGDEIPKKP